LEFHILDIDPLRLVEPPSDKLVQVFEFESVLAVVKPDVGYAVVVAQLSKGALPDLEKCCCLLKIQQPVNDLNFGLHPPVEPEDDLKPRKTQKDPIRRLRPSA
jgi:hypothetical protein